jgi:hypothetical protein
LGSILVWCRPVYHLSCGASWFYASYTNGRTVSFCFSQFLVFHITVTHDSFFYIHLLKAVFLSLLVWQAFYYTLHLHHRCIQPYLLHGLSKYQTVA